MHYRCEHPSKNPLTYILLFSCFTILTFLVFGSCTNEDQTEIQKPGKIVRSIKKAVPPPSVPLNEEKAEGQKDIKPGAEPFSPEGVPEEQGETAGVTQELKTPHQEDQSETMQDTTAAAQAPDDIPVKEQPETQQEQIDREGFYRVQKGDSLSKIAERDDVYDNPLKWTSLFRLNMDKFEGAKPVHDFQNQELPEGLDLKFVTASEAADNRTKFGNTIYAVNVLSAETSAEIVPRTITLLKNGYNAYICTATVKGKEWMRLRAGFFKSRSEAVQAGKQISSVLEGAEMWVVKISNIEIQDYCGY